MGAGDVIRSVIAVGAVLAAVAVNASFPALDLTAFNGLVVAFGAVVILSGPLKPAIIVVYTDTGLQGIVFLAVFAVAIVALFMAVKFTDQKDRGSALWNITVGLIGFVTGAGFVKVGQVASRSGETSKRSENRLDPATPRRNRRRPKP